jgi:hypothetical protein
MGGDSALLAIDSTVGIGGVCPHIIGGRRLQPRNGADEGAQAVAIGAVQVAHRRFGRHAPALRGVKRQPFFIPFSKI